MLGSTFSRKNGSSSRWWVSDSHREERSQRDVLEKRLILILCMLPGFDCGWEVLKRKLCFQTVITQHPFWLTKTILALKRVKPSGAALCPWMSDRCHHESEKKNYRTTKWADRSSDAGVGSNYTHSGVSKTNKGNIKDTGTAALLVRSATKPVLLCTRTHTVALVPGQITASTAASKTNHKWHYCLFAISHPSYLHLIVTWHLKEKCVK